MESSVYAESASGTIPGTISPELRAKVAAVAADQKARADAAKAEGVRRLAAQEITDYIKSKMELYKAVHGVDLQVSRVLVTLKKPKTYYAAWLEAAAMIARDTYLLDRKVGETIAEVLPEAARRAGYRGALRDSIWYDEFSVPLQKRVNIALERYGCTDKCNSLSKVRDLVKSHGARQQDADKTTGQDFPQGSFSFNGDGTVCWFGNELSIRIKGTGKTRYVTVKGKDINIVKTLESMGVSRETIDRWAMNAEAAHRQRLADKGVHDKNLADYHWKYD